MSTKGAGRGSGRGRGTALAAIAILAAMAVGACGTSNFANDPRPAAQIEVTATVTEKKVTVSPSNFGSGVVDFTVANMSASSVRFVISGKNGASTGEIRPGQPASLQVELPQGDYRASGEGSKAEPAKFTVAAKRPSSKNRLLLP